MILNSHLEKMLNFKIKIKTKKYLKQTIIKLSFNIEDS
jgi:hypothetical protein